ncbi:uncharacterized protein [Miscanthus floridulus]|uniref:uncharacterized protein n=1 Tax=Miscanthus floridulus TaxID=154761 RepID=UPI003459BE66
MAITFDQEDHLDRIPHQGRYPLMVSLIVGTSDNFRKEPLTFEVVNFPGVYHDLLDRPCFAKFMAIPNYTYLKLKMPSPKGVITVEGNFEQAYYYEQDHVTQPAALIAPCGLDGPRHDVERVPVEEAIKAAAVLDRPSIGEAANTPSIAVARLAPPSRRSTPRSS